MKMLASKSPSYALADIANPFRGTSPNGRYGWTLALVRVINRTHRGTVKRWIDVDSGVRREAASAPPDRTAAITNPPVKVEATHTLTGPGQL